MSGRVSSASSPRLPDTRPKSTACRRCHSRKVKCSGSKPCVACVGSGCGDECSYPPRDRQVKVSQSYIDRLLAENERLRRCRRDDRAEPSVAEPPTCEGLGAPGQSQGPIRNPLFGDRPWFAHISTSEAPILIGEAADSAFATRLRQTLSDAQLSHIPRTNYPSDATILELMNTHCLVPSPERARFLLMAALKIVSERRHVVLRSVALEDLEWFLRGPASCDAFLSCRIWALLALGEVYSARMVSPDCPFPGLAFFAQASRALHVMKERPNLGLVEMLLLLAFYSLAANRRHSAYSLAGSAVRYGAIIGLNLNITEHQLSDRIEREHRNRVWWAAYEFDRLLASSLGQPTAVQDDDIQVDLPSNLGLPTAKRRDFLDAEYLVAQITLAKLAGQTTKSLYGRNSQKEPFSQRVQQALKDLRDWVHRLPGSLQIDRWQSSQRMPERTRSLHLAFNQCVVAATRPVLLYALRTQKDVWRNSPQTLEPKIPESVLPLTVACIRCARHSYCLLTEAWVDGSFTTFAYLHVQYLFTVATILSISALLKGPSSSKDWDDFEHAVQLLEELKRCGNYAAIEFHQHLIAIRENVEAIWSQGQAAGTCPNDMPAGPFGLVESGSGISPYEGVVLTYSGSFMTAEMALAEPSLQAFLTQTDSTLQLLDRSILDSGTYGFYLAS